MEDEPKLPMSTDALLKLIAAAVVFSQKHSQDNPRASLDEVVQATQAHIRDTMMEALRGTAVGEA